MPELPADDIRDLLQRTAALWPSLRGARLFITGGSGFFGQWLLESFIGACDRFALDATALVLTRDPARTAARLPHLAAHPAIALWEGEIRSFPFPAVPFTHIVHAATPPSTRMNAEQPVEMWSVIADGTRRVLELARQCGTPRLLFTSSGAVYGTQPPELPGLPEDYPGAPDPLAAGAAYGVGKRAAEFLCAAYARAHGITAVIARPFAFVGPGLPLDAHYAVGNFIRDGLAGGPIRVHGDGTPARSYLYAADLAGWLWTLLLCGTPGRAYNVGAEAAVSIAELAHMVAAQCSPSPAVEIACPPQPGAPARYVPDTTRARRELGLAPAIPLADGIRRTIAWHRRMATSIAPSHHR